jgi:L-alanine-DL-glutamate epimerase-like enolase superfamily enzyme
VSTYAKLADLPLHIDSYDLSGLEVDVSSDFTRLTTLIRMQGGGHEGVGEDVTYDALDHVALQDAGPVLPLAGDWTLGSFGERVAELDLFPAEPVRDVSRLYRRWAYESAALDLALRQAGSSLAEALGREARPVTFVVSLRLGKPATLNPVRRRLDAYPTLRFKLDPTSEWTDEVIAALVETGAVDSVDFKGHYKGTVVDQPPDPDLYRRVVEAFPDAWIEDPALTD